MTDWALGEAAPNAVARAVSDLTDQKIPHHIFWLKKLGVKHGKVVPLLKPAFGRYVFLPFDSCLDIVRRTCRFISNVYWVNEEVLRVPDELIKEQLQRCEPGTNIIVEEKEPLFKAGDRVRIAGDTVFAGMTAIYDLSFGNGKARLTLDNAARVSVDEANLQPMDKKKRKRRKRRR